MTARSLRRWSWVHRWSSLVCTVFLLLLCITGLPLNFSHEIDELTGAGFSPVPMAADAPRASLDAVARSAMQEYPGRVPLYFFAEEDEPDLWYVKLDKRTDTDERDAVLLAVDARTAEPLGAPDAGEGFMSVMYRLHVDLFSGLTRHKHAYHACWAVIMLNVIVGAANSVGGLIGFDPACNGITDDPENVVQFRPSIWEEDGFMNDVSLLMA